MALLEAHTVENTEKNEESNSTNKKIKHKHTANNSRKKHLKDGKEPTKPHQQHRWRNTEHKLQKPKRGNVPVHRRVKIDTKLTAGKDLTQKSSSEPSARHTYINYTHFLFPTSSCLVTGVPAEKRRVSNVFTIFSSLLNIKRLEILSLWCMLVIYRNKNRAWIF